MEVPATHSPRLGPEKAVNAGEAFGFSPATINEIAKHLWTQCKEVMVFYNRTACPCAFPRFRQLVAFDGIVDGGSCYCSETEAFIQFARDSFQREPIDDTGENSRERWICQTCKSSFTYGWSDFSIRVSRAYLKEEQICAKDVGAPRSPKLVVHLGVFGHAYPPEVRGTIQVVELTNFDQHMRELAA